MFFAPLFLFAALLHGGPLDGHRLAAVAQSFDGHRIHAAAHAAGHVGKVLAKADKKAVSLPVKAARKLNQARPKLFHRADASPTVDQVAFPRPFRKCGRGGCRDVDPLVLA